MLVRRVFWHGRIETAWRHRSVVWLMGVRRVGKSVLAQTLPDVEYYDCELPRVRRLLEDSQAFWGEHRGKRIVLDEVHRLPNPSEVLKIAADHFPDVRVLATGSSTLGTSARFRDTLAGRKAEVWLTPMMLEQQWERGLRHRHPRTHLRWRARPRPWSHTALATVHVERRAGVRRWRFCPARRRWKSFAHVQGGHKFTRLS